MTDRCTYTFDPDQWDQSSEIQCHLDYAWSCPHETYGEADTCIFHLSPEERRERGIDKETVANAISDIVENEGPQPKQLIGATLTDIKLSRVILESPDRHPLDLRHATISGCFSLNSSTVELPIDLRGARIDNVDWQETTLTSDCYFTDAIINNTFNISNSVFKQDVDLERIRCEGPVIADETRFRADTCLRDSVFNSIASFDGVEFHGDANLLDDDACFERANFADEVTFRKAQFRYADFVECEFGGDVDFDEVTFTGDAEFARASIRGDASFRGATFEGDSDVLIDDADFSDTSFEGLVEFNRANFSVATFEGASFEDDVVFNDVVFDEDTKFKNSAFESDVKFTEARFHDDADFSLIKIKGDAVFLGAEFHGGDNVKDDDLTFESAEIVGDLNFRNTRARLVNFTSLSAADSTFSDATIEGDAIFTNATFSGHLDLSECRFKGDSEFTSVTVEDGLSARGAEFQGRDNIEDDDASFMDITVNGDMEFLAASFRYVSFENAIVSGEATFEESSFDDDAIFDDIEVIGSVTFDEARFNDDASFQRVEFTSPATFKGVEFRGGANVRDDDVTFANSTFGDYVSFEGAQFRRAVFSGVTINGVAEFLEAKFRRTTDFSEVEFANRVSFTEARFLSDTSFEDACFVGEAVFSGAEFQGEANIRDDDVTFSGAIFENDVLFNHAEFSYANFQSVLIEGEAEFNSTNFHDTAVFVDATFADSMTFAEATFKDDANFERLSVEQNASFFGVEFEGGNSEKDDALFTDAMFGGDINFREIECDSFGFEGVTVDGNSQFMESVFGRIRADEACFRNSVDFSCTRYTKQSSFVGVKFEDKADFNEIRFMSDVCFAETSFECGVSFQGTEFRGGDHTVDDADFEATWFGDTADFKLAEFRDADFTGAEFDDTSVFVETTFSDIALFQQATFNESALFSRTTFTEGADFSSARFGDTSHFDEVQFKADTTFADATFASDATFIASEFTGRSNRHDDDASFESTTFSGIANFKNVSFRYANFTKTGFNKRGNFTGAEFSHTVMFRPQPVDDDSTLVSLVDTTVHDGKLGQPEHGSVFYDCTGGELHSVTLDDKYCDRELFDYFRICDTDFHGFDFTSHKAHLAENDWIIHEFGAEEHLLNDDQGDITNPALLENTYLKAKNCASDFGDRKAAAEFFIREMLYRRQKNRQIAVGKKVGSVNDLSLGTRINAVGKWIGNTVLYETCGYGERLWRVLYVSFAVIFVWGLMYTFMPTGVEGDGVRSLDTIIELFTPEGIAVLGRNMYFSTATFMTMEHVSASPGSSAARWLASIQTFSGALLIALVVFVLGRRVAW